MRFRDHRKTGPRGLHLKLGRTACTICNHYFMGHSMYIIFLGLIGTMITAYDIIRIINYKFCAKCLPRSRINEVVPVAVERDLRLMTSVLGIEHYSLIMLGVITEYPMLYTPWLLMQLCIFITEVIIFCVRLLLDGLYIKHTEMFKAIFMVFNWLQVFCLFYKQAQIH